MLPSNARRLTWDTVDQFDFIFADAGFVGGVHARPVKRDAQTVDVRLICEEVQSFLELLLRLVGLFFQYKSDGEVGC